MNLNSVHLRSEKQKQFPLKGKDNNNKEGQVSETQGWVRKGGKQSGSEGGKKFERESAQKRLSIFRLLRAQSTRSVIISQFAVFGTDRYIAGRPRAQGLWFTMKTVYYSDCACLWGCAVPSERETERGAENKRTEWARMSEKRRNAVPPESFYRKGSGERRRQSWHNAASGSTASHSSPLPVGTQTSWYTYRRRRDNSYQPVLRKPVNTFTRPQKMPVVSDDFQCAFVSSTHILKWLQTRSMQNFKIEFYMDMKNIKCFHW